MDLLQVLKKNFGFNNFRSYQEDIINAIIEKNDVLAIMPTGGGKSICYQLPAIIQEGLTIVISPLISLMKDQVDSVLENGIAAAYINSTIDNLTIKSILNRAKLGEYKILYVAPERLESLEFLNNIAKINISLVAVDEAHCISSWGHDFRVSYGNIHKFIDCLNKRPVVAAFTATATKEVKEDIIKQLNLHNPKIFVSSFDRENLFIDIKRGINKEKYILNYIQDNKNVSGIIYALTRKNVENIYNKLTQKGFNVAKYHGGMNSSDRNSNQEDFIYDRKNIIVATNAFGMGIDKSNIRFIIHYNMPQNIEGYYQEIGRAGRDGEKSKCILLFSPQDVQLSKYLIENSTENIQRKNIQYKKLQDMVDYIYTAGCYRKYLLNYFGEDYDKHCNNCTNCTSQVEKIDKTIDGQKVISCIYKMKKSFGISTIVDVLRGSKNSKIIKLGFNNLSTYGIMKEYKKEELRDFINVLISEGFLSIKEGEYPVVILNQNSFKVVRNLQKIILNKDINTKNEFVQNELFELLKDIRTNIALKENIPPYVVFSDKTLIEMANRYPENEIQFLDISGVGSLKYQKYGKIFLDKIIEYKKNNNIVQSFTKANDEDYYDMPQQINIQTNKELLKLLIERRNEIAKKKNVLVQKVIPLRSLKEISGRYPRTIEEMMDITLIGPAKAKEYGQDIINVVCEYINKNNLNKQFEFKNKSKIIIDGETRNNEEICIDSLKNGDSLEKISNDNEISISTIMGYVYNFIKLGNSIDFNFEYSKYYIEKYDQDIKDAITNVGFEKISLIKKMIPEEIKYENIRSYIFKKILNL